VKILVIRFSSIGDIVLTSPVFRCIKNQLPGVILHLATKSDFKVVTASNPNIDGFVYFKDDFAAFIEECKLGNFDVVVDLQNNLKSLKIKRALNVKSYTVNKLNIEKFFLTGLRMDIMPDAHFTDRCLETVSPLGIKDDGSGLDYFIPNEDIIEVKDIPVSHHAGFICIVMGATYYTKRLPPEKLIELVKGIRHPIVLLGGKDDKEAGELVAAADSIKVYNACGKFNINESADLVRRSKLVISNDTGLMHIAAAFQKPIISIWGSTDIRFGMYPYYGKFSKQQYWDFEVKLYCRPCSKLGYNKCPLGHFKCMKKQDIDAIVRLTHNQLGIR